MHVRGRPPSLVATTALLVVVMLATGACSRLSFVRQDFTRQDYERVTPEVDVSGKGGNRNAALALQHLQLAQVRLMGGDPPFPYQVTSVDRLPTETAQGS